MSSADVDKITISSEHWEDDDIKEIVEMFTEKFPTETKDIARWEAEELAPVLWLGIGWIGGKIAEGFLNALGSDIWMSFKEKLLQKNSEKNYSEVRLMVEGKNQKITFDLKASDNESFKKGLDSLDEVIKKINPDELRQDYHFDVENSIWVKESTGKIVKTISGVSIAADVPFEKNGRTIMLRKEDLPEYASQQEGLPLTLGHGGRVIGIITKAWVDDNKVKFEAGIFEGLSEEEEKQLNESTGVSVESSHSGFKEYRQDENSSS